MQPAQPAGSLPPILIGVYRQAHLMSWRSEPAILGAVPGRVWMTGQSDVLLDAPASRIRAKGGRRLGQITLRCDGRSHTVAYFSTLHFQPFSGAQLQELDASRSAVMADPRTQTLMAGRALYLATGGPPEGDFAAGARYLRSRPLGRLVDHAAALEELLRSVGVRL